MPRPNAVRSMYSERALARRVAYERQARDMSLEGLARRMTDAGCSMNASAIYKIEKGDPPRRITVDELVAFSTVFSLDLDELLLPRASGLIAEVRRLADLDMQFGRQMAALLQQMAQLSQQRVGVAAEMVGIFQALLEEEDEDEDKLADLELREMLAARNARRDVAGQRDRG